MRTNQCPTPRPTSPAWAQNSEFGGVVVGGTVTNDTTVIYPAPGIASSCKVVWPAAPGGVSNLLAPVLNLVVGRVYTATIWVFCPSGNPDPYMEVAFVANGSSTSVKDQWTPVTITWTCTVVGQFVGVRVSNPTAGQVLYVGACLVEEGAKSGTYFDGDWINSQWAGTVNASTSVCLSMPLTLNRTSWVLNPSWRLTSGTVEARRNVCPNPNFETDVTSWSLYTNVAAPTRTNTGPFSGSGRLQAVGDNTGVNPRVAVTMTGFVAGDVWTLSARIRKDGTFPSGGGAYVALRWQLTPSGETVQALNPTFTPDANGWMLVTVTGTVPATTNGSLVVNLGFAGISANLTAAGSIGVDEVLVEKAGGALPYFDGNTPTLNGLTAAWLAAVNESASTLAGPAFGTVYPFVAYAGELGAVSWQSAPGVHRLLLKNGAANSDVIGFTAATASLVPASQNDYWGGRVKVRQVGGSGSTTILLRLASYNGAGSFTGTYLADSGNVVLPANGAWVDVPVPCVNPDPATIATARWLVYQGGTGSPAGTVIEFKEALQERVSGVGVAPGAYFDGAMPNADWFVGAETSASQLILLSQNPNWPVVDVRAWVQEDPAPTGTSPTTNPLILSDRAKSATWSMGRQYELDQDEAAEGTVVVDNTDGALSAGSNGCYPMRAAAVKASWAGVTYPLYRGYVGSWPEQDLDPGLGESTLALVDLFEPLANRPLRSMITEAILASSVLPTMYVPLTDAVGSTGAGNIGSGTAYPTAPLVDYKQGGVSTAAFGGSSFLVNNSDGMWSYTYAGGAANHATQLQIVGPRNVSGYALDMTNPWMVEVWASITAGASIVWSALDGYGFSLASIVLDWTNSQIVFAAGGNTFTISIAQAALAAGLQIVLGYDGTHSVASIYGGGANKHTFTYTIPGALWSPWIAVGPSFNPYGLYTPYQGTFTIGHVAMWHGPAGIPTDTDFTNHNNAGYFAYSGDTAEARIARVTSWAGQPGVVGDSSGTFLGPMQDTRGSSALDVVKGVALDALGRVNVKAGMLNFLSRSHGQSTLTPQWVLGSNTSAGEIPFTGSPGFDYDKEHVYNDVSVSRVGGSVQRWTASFKRYFQRVLQVSLNLYYDSDAQYAAQWLANRYSSPAVRIRTVTVSPGENPALWPFCLGVQLGDTVLLNHRALGRPVKSTKCQVQKITHNIDGGSSWTVDLELAPVLDYWLLAAMHTTLAASAVAGATSLSLNPLPDSATNASEASLAVGTTLMLDPAGFRETVTITSVASAPTPGVSGYTSITVGVTATLYAHASGVVACDPLPNGVTDPTIWDARSVLDSTTRVTF